jgi:N-acyl-D-amino-acid deacylase
MRHSSSATRCLLGHSFSASLATIFLIATIWLSPPTAAMGEEPEASETTANLVEAEEPAADTVPSPLPRSVLTTGDTSEEFRPLDELMLRVIRDEDVPGAALAVARQGKLMYARGFGERDREEKLPVLPTSLFRIASLSKPITAVAILQLAEKEELDLDDRVFDILAVEAFRENGDDELDPRLEHITVRHLLNHTSGWDRDQSYDPMFRSVQIAESLGIPPPAQAEHVIQYMRGKPLDFDPGARYAYSNLGYSLLGRIVEQKSGLPYDDYVKQHIFEPVGISMPRIGDTRKTASFEVKYYHSSDEEGNSVYADNLGAKVPHPYGAWCLEAMDAHGGWIASAIDLVRFSVAVHAGTDGGLISDESLARMVERPEGRPGHDEEGKEREVYYGLGWQVRPRGAPGSFNSWHTGSLPGTWTLLVHRHDDMHWALLLNTRKDRGNNDLMSRLDRQLHEAVDAVAGWPEDDLFPRYLQSR